MSGQPNLPATPLDLPMLPLRDVVVFPHMVIPLFVGRPKSIKALESAMASERRIMLVAQKTAAKDEPEVADMFDVGCVSTILQMLKLPDGTVKVLVEGQQRAQVQRIEDGEAHFVATVLPVDPQAEQGAGEPSEIEALRRAVMQQFDQYVKLNKKILPASTSLAGVIRRRPRRRRLGASSWVRPLVWIWMSNTVRCATTKIATGKTVRR